MEGEGTPEQKDKSTLIEQAVWDIATDVIRRGANTPEIKKFLRKTNPDTGYSNRILVARALMDKKAADGKFVVQVARGAPDRLAQADDIRFSNDPTVARGIILNENFPGWRMNGGTYQLDGKDTLDLVTQIASVQGKIEKEEKLMTRSEYLEKVKKI